MCNMTPFNLCTCSINYAPRAKKAVPRKKGTLYYSRARILLIFKIEGLQIEKPICKFIISVIKQKKINTERRDIVSLQYEIK